MELISSPKAEYLLDANLDSLHAESREWLNEIYFWNDEMSFFYRLIHVREQHLSFPTADLAALEKEMIQISTENLSKVKREIENHERSLCAMVKNTSLDDEQDYRERHRRLIMDMHTTRRLISTFKKQVFSFIE